MKTNLNIQKNGENLIKDNLLKESESKPKKVYFFMGDIKESGFDILEECLIDLKARKLIVIGVNKKNTTKKMLDTLLSYTKSVYIFNNNGMVEFDSNICVFEHEKRAKIYIMNAHVSEGALVDNIATYTTIEYDLENSIEDAASYKEFIDNLVSISKLDTAIKLEKPVIKTLFDEGQIFTPKQYTHSVMTIAELLGEKKEENKTEDSKDDDIEIAEDRVETKSEKIPTVDLSDMDDFAIDIDIDIDESIQKEEELLLEMEEPKKEEKTSKKKEAKASKVEEVVPEYVESEDLNEEFEFDENAVLDIESMLFEKSDIELDKKSINKKLTKEKEESEEGKSVTKKVDLTKVSNLIMELPKKATKGKDVAVIKVPNYIKDMIPDFFGNVAKFKSVEKVDGSYRETTIKLEIIDIVTGEKYSDVSAKLSQKTGQTYITFTSEHFKDISYDENDIIRIIKLAEGTYHMEIVSQNVQEYKIWKKLCTKNFKGSSRSYGVM